jgi:hypothetical protein
MQSRDFVYWLQGYLEIADPKGITPEQLKIVRNHLALVFKHEIDPAMGDKQHQNTLSNIHSGNIDNIKLRC